MTSFILLYNQPNNDACMHGCEFLAVVVKTVMTRSRCIPGVPKKVLWFDS